MTLLRPTRSVLIFGGAGFVGANWASHLLANTSARVHIFDNLSRRRVEHNLRWLEHLAEGTKRLEITIADVRDSARVAQAVQEATEIYHFAAQVAVTTSLDDPRNDFEVNAAGTLNILEAARQSGTSPFLLFTSTNKVYGKITTEGPVNGNRYQPVRECQPLDFYSPYGCSKGTADQYVHDYARIFGLPTVVFRMSCIAGARQFGNEDQGWVAHFVYAALQGRTISIYGDGHQVRDVLSVEDLLRAFEAAYANRSTTAGEVFNIGGGVENATSLLDLVAAIERTLPVTVRCRFCPARPGDQPIYVTDFSKFSAHTRWQPKRRLTQIVDDISRWYNQNEGLFTPASYRIPASKMRPEALGGVAS